MKGFTDAASPASLHPVQDLPKVEPAPGVAALARECRLSVAGVNLILRSPSQAAPEVLERLESAASRIGFLLPVQFASRDGNPGRIVTT